MTLTVCAPSAPVHSECHSILYKKKQWERNGSVKYGSPLAMEGLSKIRDASRANCERIASCPITLSRSSSICYDKDIWKEKDFEGLPRNGSL